MSADSKKKRKKLAELIATINSHCTGAYAAQSAYFFVLSMIPILLLLLTLVQYTPLSKEMVIKAVVEVFPKTVNTMVISIVTQVYERSASFIPITILVALWGAGKGVLAITCGLNKVYGIEETRNYFILRIRASFYTIVFIIAIIFSLLLSVFGNTLSLFITAHFPFMETFLEYILKFRTFGTFIVLTLFWILIYRFLPNRKDTLRHQIPGAIFTAAGWQVMSFVFSVYLDVFTGFSNMYGSMTTIVLILLWLYGCMFIILIGGEVNVLLFPKFRGRLEKEISQQQKVLQQKRKQRKENEDSKLDKQEEL